MKLNGLEKLRGKRVAVALSGGVDSSCLLRALLDRAEEFSLTLSAVHVEHGIRGKESLRDMRFCEELAAKWGVPLVTVRADVPALAKKTGRGTEETARQVRYDAFSALLREKKCDFVATAHHRDDVAETVLFRLARGTALAGMRTVQERQGIVRPLLSVSREEIEAFARARGVPFVVDSTNADETYARNRIRASVLPELGKVNARAAEHIAEFAARAAADDEYLTEIAKREISQSGGAKSVPVSLPDPLFFRACLAAMGAERDYTSANLEEIAKLRALQSGRKVCLPGGTEAAREYERIVFYRPAPPETPHPFSPADLAPPSAEALRVDLDRIPADAIVRTRRDGDRFTPFGGREKPLKKFFSDRKIPARIGNRLPLVAVGSEVLVVIGAEISDKVRVTDSTARVGYFSARKND